MTNSKDIIPVVIKPTNNIQTNLFVSVRIWINGIEKRKLITDDDIETQSYYNIYTIAHFNKLSN